VELIFVLMVRCESLNNRIIDFGWLGKVTGRRTLGQKAKGKRK